VEKSCTNCSNSDKPQPIDDIVERSGLNSREVLATLFNLEMKGIVRQSPGEIVQQDFSVAGKLQPEAGLTALI